jgi:hypothetical protein
MRTWFKVEGTVPDGVDSLKLEILMGDDSSLHWKDNRGRDVHIETKLLLDMPKRKRSGAKRAP